MMFTTVNIVNIVNIVVASVFVGFRIDGHWSSFFFSSLSSTKLNGELSYWGIMAKKKVKWRRNRSMREEMESTFIGGIMWYNQTHEIIYMNTTRKTSLTRFYYWLIQALGSLRELAMFLLVKRMKLYSYLRF